MQLSLDILKKCWFLAGPTASGKSAAGVHLAERLSAEIVSLDSMSLYRGMDVGTDKPSPAARRSVPHHLIDVIAPHETYSLADYVQAAETACREIVARGRIPLFVGGTGLYLRGVLRGVFDAPRADWEFRKRLEAEATQHDAGYIHRRLQRIDRQAAAVLHPNDIRRLVRALEVYHVTGRPLTEQQTQSPLPPDQRPRHVYWLSPPRKWLYERINQRVDRMFAEGLLDEVQLLRSAGSPMNRTAQQAIGYKEAIQYLEGQRTLSETVELVKTRTRQFAKRQHTWFRNLEECRAVEISGNESAEQLAEMVQRIAGVSAASCEDER